MTIRSHSEHAKLPYHATIDAAGYDLYAAEDVTIDAWRNSAVSTGISITSFPKNCYGRIAGRSGLALYDNILVGAGVIDRDYTGIVKVVLFNFNDKPFHIAIGDRIAQLICEVYIQPSIQNYATSAKQRQQQQQQEQKRGDNGFGSTSW